MNDWPFVIFIAIITIFAGAIFFIALLAPFIVVLAIVVLSGCGVYLKSGKDSVNEELQAGGGLYLFNGWDNVHDCDRAWRGEIPPSQEDE